MEIQEMQAKKAALEGSISNMLLQFSRETGVKVDAVCLNNIASMTGGPVAYVVKLDVRL